MRGFTDPTTLALLGASSGFLDPDGGMAAGFQGAMKGYQAGNDMQRQKASDAQEAQKAQSKTELQSWLKENITPDGNGKFDIRNAGNKMLATGHPELMGMGINLLKQAPKAKYQNVNNNGVIERQAEFDDGNIGASGGLPIAAKAMQVNQGDKVSLVDPYARGELGVNMSQGESARLAQSQQQFGASHGLAQQNAATQQQNAQLSRQKMMMEMNPEYQAQKAGNVAFGKEQAKSKADLSGSIGVLAESLNLSDDLKNHPALENMVGSLPRRTLGKGLALYGDNKEADFSAKLEQSQGKQFLSAIQAMRGMGQLTEREGDKMQASAAAMSTAQSPAAFKKAQDDYQAALMSGVRKVAFQSGMPEASVMEMLNQERSTLRSDAKPKKSSGSNDGWGDLK